MEIYKVAKLNYYGTERKDYYFNTEENARKDLTKEDYIYKVEIVVDEDGCIKVAKEEKLVNLLMLENEVKIAKEKVEFYGKLLEEEKARKPKTAKGEERKAKNVAEKERWYNEKVERLARAEEELAKALKNK